MLAKEKKIIIYNFVCFATWDVFPSSSMLYITKKEICAMSYK
jgi:hypothetical protein